MMPRTAWWLATFALAGAATSPSAQGPRAGTGPGDVALHPDSVRVWDADRARGADRSLPPVEADGELRFAVDGAAFVGENGEHRLEVYVVIPHVPLEWLRSGQRYRAELLARLVASDEDEQTKRAAEIPLVLDAESFEETRRVGARSIRVLATTLSFRPARVDVDVRDTRSQKKTLLGRIGGSHEGGAAAFVLPAERGRGGALSDLVFAHEAGPPDATGPLSLEASLHGDVAVRPNPMRFYGVERRVFPVYFEVYGDRGAPVGAVSLRYRVANASGQELLAGEDRIEEAGPRTGRIQRFDVTGFPTGTYGLSVALVDEAGAVLDIAHGDFHVIWNESALLRDEKTILDDARVLLSPEEFSRFEEMPPGQRAAFLAALWEQIDSDPETATNETRNRFRRRLEQAERLYGGIDGGKLSARGRVLIRYGEPEEKTVVRIPNRHDTFEQAVRTEIGGSLSNVVDVNDPRLRSFFLRRFDATTAFEIWTYLGAGDPILEHQRSSNRGMAFIFVDVSGTGFYELGYTSVAGMN